LCYGACPVSRTDPTFTGPAILAKLYRFLADSRERRNGETHDADGPAARVWKCHSIAKCTDVCPKDVRPSDGIRGVRWELLTHKVRRLLRRK
jgi:succinate dehydrogenase / fumarate reductase, iron-sulfur subunit